MNFLYLKSLFSKLLIILLVVIFSGLSFISPAFAVDGFDLEKPVSVRLHYAIDNTPCADIQFHIYQVAKMTAYNEYEWTQGFKKYNIDLKTETDEDLMAMANTLSSYITRDNIMPTQSIQTDFNGDATFPLTSENYTAGIYVVLGESHEDENSIYYPLPALAILPYTLENHLLSYECDIDIKHESKPVPDDGGSSSGTPVHRTVVKVWEGENINHPSSVEVQLLKNGKVYDTVVLSNENNWKHSWNDLSGKAKWEVVEKNVPDDYVVSISQTGAAYTISNRYQVPETPVIPDIPDPSNPNDQTPSPGDTPGPNEPDVPDENPNVPNKELFPEATDKIPQTGTLWFLVPVFAGIGVVSLILSMAPVKRGEKKHDKKAS